MMLFRIRSVSSIFRCRRCCSWLLPIFLCYLSWFAAPSVRQFVFELYLTKRYLVALVNFSSPKRPRCLSPFFSPCPCRPSCMPVVRNLIPCHFYVLLTNKEKEWCYLWYPSFWCNWFLCCRQVNLFHAGLRSILWFVVCSSIRLFLFHFFLLIFAGILSNMLVSACRIWHVHICVWDLPVGLWHVNGSYKRCVACLWTLLITLPGVSALYANIFLDYNFYRMCVQHSFLDSNVVEPGVKSRARCIKKSPTLTGHLPHFQAWRCAVHNLGIRLGICHLHGMATNPRRHVGVRGNWLTASCYVAMRCTRWVYRRVWQSLKSTSLPLRARVATRCLILNI